MREDVHARLLDQAAKPLHQFVERNDVVAVIAQRRRSDRQFPGARGGEEIGGIVRDRRIERGCFREIGNEFREAARVHHRAGKLVRANFARLFEDVDIFGGKFRLAAGFVVLAHQARQMQRAGQSRRPRADDQYIRFESFAFRAMWCFLASMNERVAARMLASFRALR